MYFVFYKPIMFHYRFILKVDKDGKALPEKYPICIYDRNLDRELIEETLLLMQAIKKQKAIKKVILDTINKQKQESAELQSKIDNEMDSKKKEISVKKIIYS